MHNFISVIDFLNLSSSSTFGINFQIWKKNEMRELMRRRKHFQLKLFAFGYLFNTLTTPTSINIICKFHVWMTAVLQNNGNINETWLYKCTQFSSNLTPKKLFCAQSSRMVAYKYLTWLVLAISKFYFLSISFVLRPRSTKDIVYSLASDKKTTIVRLSILTVM